MIIVRVELHSAVTGEVTELARMHICNDGTEGSEEIGNYTVRTLRGRDTKALDKNQYQRIAQVLGHPRLKEHVWNLVTKALLAMKYGTPTSP